ncbi:glucoamylase family protein [Actinopolymorpha singaporensis]
MARWKRTAVPLLLALSVAGATPALAAESSATSRTEARALVRTAVQPFDQAAAQAGEQPMSDAIRPAERQTLLRYARDTWRSFDAMVVPSTGLPADYIGGDLAPATRSGYTSPTNVGGYLWSTVAARDLGLVGAREADRRVEQTLDTLGRLSFHEPSGMFYNWYDPATGTVLREWPEDGGVVHPFLSSVDNGWLAAALMVVRGAMPARAAQAQHLLDRMDFGFFYDPQGRGADFPAGLLRGGFWDEEPPGCSVTGNYRDRGPNVWYTCNHYDILNTEPRIASYIGIAMGQIPARHYYAPYRTFPASCDWSWLEQRPTGFSTSYLGVPVFEGSFEYRGLRFVPTWGGDMFEALMPAMFVPEERWGPRSWGLNHPAYVQGQIEHGLDDAEYGYWGFSPASDPRGGYAAWGVDQLGMDPGGYPSDLEGTNVDRGYEGCRPAQPARPFGDGVVTPHASFLALPYAQHAAVDNLVRLERDFDSYGPGGFYDAVAVRSGTVARRYLALDQAMVLGPIGNALSHDDIRGYFSRGQVERAIRPLLARERFSAGRSAGTDR